MKLRDCAEVKTGLVLARKSIKEFESGEEVAENATMFPHLTLKCFSAKGILEKEHLGEIRVNEDLDTRYLTQEGDIVMRMSAPYTAVLISKDDVGLVITSNFVRIRVKSREISPLFLCWVLNSEEMKRKIKIATNSIMLGSVSPQVLSNMELNLLSQELQEKVGRLHHLFQREQQLLVLLQEKKNVYQTAVLTKIYKCSKGE